VVYLRRVKNNFKRYYNWQSLRNVLSLHVILVIGTDTNCCVNARNTSTCLYVSKKKKLCQSGVIVFGFGYFFSISHSDIFRQPLRFQRLLLYDVLMTFYNKYTNGVKPIRIAFHINSIPYLVLVIHDVEATGVKFIVIYQIILCLKSEVVFVRSAWFG